MGEARVTLARLHPEMLEPLHVAPAAGLLAPDNYNTALIVFECFFYSA